MSLWHFILFRLAPFLKTPPSVTTTIATMTWSTACTKTTTTTRTAGPESGTWACSQPTADLTATKLGSLDRTTMGRGVATSVPRSVTTIHTGTPPHGSWVNFKKYSFRKKIALLCWTSAVFLDFLIFFLISWQLIFVIAFSFTFACFCLGCGHPYQQCPEVPRLSGQQSERSVSILLWRSSWIHHSQQEQQQREHPYHKGRVWGEREWSLSAKRGCDI